MKKTLVHSIAVLATAFAASTAQAIPIYFDFSGTVTSADTGASLGTAVSGGFRLESDQFAFAGAAGDVQYSWIAWQPQVASPLAFITIGDASYTFPTGDDYYALINFADGCQPLCNLGWTENFNVSAYNRTGTAPDFTGVARSSSVALYSLYQNRLPAYPFWQGYDQFVGSEMQPIDVLSLPLGITDASFTETIWNCVSGSCTADRSISYGISLDSVTRGTGSQSVPEPGTLTLFGLGIAGVFAARRRKAASAR